MATSIVMPKLGLTMTEGTVIEWLKKPGDRIQVGEGVVTISSEKLTNEVEAPVSGILLEVKVKEDEEVPVGEVIGIIGEEGELTGSGKAESYQVSSRQAEEPAQLSKKLRVSPAARKKARELGVNILEVQGTGPKGRITRKDIEQYAAKKVHEQPIAQVAPTLEIPRVQETTPSTIEGVKGESLSSMRSTIAKRMHHSLAQTAQLTLHRKARVDKLLQFQQRIREEAQSSNVKLTLTVLLARAVTLSLKDYPIMNTHLIDNQLYQYDEVHIGIATALEQGLVVPVIKHADQLSLGNLARAIQVGTEKARSQKSTAEEISGSTFTITNLGGQGIEYFTPILNTPETGILGVGAIQEELKLEQDQVVVGKNLPLSLTFDHRVVDGAPAAEFLGRVIYYLEHPYLLIL